MSSLLDLIASDFVTRKMKNATYCHLLNIMLLFIFIILLEYYY